MKIKMTSTAKATDTDGAQLVHGPAGKTYDAPQHIADQLIDQGAATAMTPNKKKRGGTDGSHK